MLTYNEGNPPFHKWIRESKKLLARNDDAKAMGNCIQIGTRQPKNLQRLVGGFKNVQDRMPPVPDPGCVKCGRCKVSCPVLNETQIFRSTNTGKEYKIRQRLSCGSDWLIYLATCKRCSGQYVGKSKTPFKIRHSNHKQEIKKRVGGLGHHYGGSGPCSYQDISITLIEQIQEKTFEILAERELYWQHQLRVYVQNGANAHCYRKDLKKWLSSANLVMDTLWSNLFNWCLFLFGSHVSVYLVPVLLLDRLGNDHWMLSKLVVCE